MAQIISDCGDVRCWMC